MIGTPPPALAVQDRHTTCHSVARVVPWRGRCLVVPRAGRGGQTVWATDQAGDTVKTRCCSG